MARKGKKGPKKDQPRKSNSRGKQVAQVGLGALLLGGLAWLIGGFTWQNALEWLKTLAIAGGIALVIRWSIGEPYKIPSGSMEPTLHGNPRFLRGDRVFVNKWVYGLRFPFNRFRIPFTDTTIHYADRRIYRGADPQRWDIVVFKAVEKNADHDTLVKRVVGLPGERVHIEDNRVYVNGEPLEFPDSLPQNMKYTSDSGMKYGILRSDAYSLVPEDHYLLLGDNSRSSKDGRYWGWVPNEHILGRVSCIAWPYRHWRDFTGFSKTWWWRTLVVLVGALFVWRLLLGRSWRVHGVSPDASVALREHLYVNRLAYGFCLPFMRTRLTSGRLPQRGELVLYEAPRASDAKGAFLLGRIAGLPGERVFLKEGKLEIDGAPADTQPLSERTYPSGDSTGPYARSKGKEFSLVSEGHYFLLADNEDDYVDGRTLGWVPKTDLIGPASAVWWPPTRWRRLRP